LKADEGDFVKSGALLARLEDQDLQASVAELKARVVYAKAQYERNLALRRSGLISQDTVDRARTDLDAARAAAQGAREKLQFTRLYAPVDGQITRRDGEIGEFIPVNQVVFYMAGPAPLRISADVDEEDVPRIKPGLRVLIHADAFPGRTFEGRVAQITPRGDPVQRSYRVRISLVNNPPLAISMTTETNIVLAERENALLVPSSAVTGGKVWVVNGRRVEPRNVVVGVVGPVRTEIRSGLTESVRVVLAPPENLKPGARVRATAVAHTSAPAAAATTTKSVAKK
jgi:RND family efflux transporter MFP subunit